MLLYSIGHPIVGDPRYGTPALRAAPQPRLMLTSTGLALRLPSGAPALRTVGCLSVRAAMPGAAVS